jgi:DNA-binding NarL/FixJ family response regulator
MTIRHLPPSCSIAVLVAFTDPIVRAGLVATLKAVPTLSVQAEEDMAVLHFETRALQIIDDIHVVVADYDSALTIASTLKRCAASRPSASTRIMIVSPRDGEADVRRALECGVRGYLPLECSPADVADGVVALHRGQRILGRIAAQRIAESFDHEALTSRELDVLRLVAAGDANKTVAKKLCIALGTVKVHVRSIMSKLDARTRTEAAAVARRRGLVELEPEAIALPPHPMRWPQVASTEASAHNGSYAALRVAHQR